MGAFQNRYFAGRPNGLLRLSLAIAFASPVMPMITTKADATEEGLRTSTASSRAEPSSTMASA